ncbi:hypothetical protein [Mesorhizobium sp. 128a]
MERRTIDQALEFLRQYRDISVSNYAPLGPDGVGEGRTLAQSSDPLEIAATADIALLNSVIRKMAASNSR